MQNCSMILLIIRSCVKKKKILKKKVQYIFLHYKNFDIRGAVIIAS